MEKTFCANGISAFTRLRKALSQFLYSGAIILFIISLIIFIWMWVYAYTNNLIPDTPWGEKLGNHGPWRRLGFWRPGFKLRDAFWYIFIAQFFSVCSVIVSFIIKPNKKAILLFGIVLVAFFLFLYTHYWLVD